MKKRLIVGLNVKKVDVDKREIVLDLNFPEDDEWTEATQNASTLLRKLDGQQFPENCSDVKIKGLCLEWIEKEEV